MGSLLSAPGPEPPSECKQLCAVSAGRERVCIAAGISKSGQC